MNTVQPSPFSPRPTGAALRGPLPLCAGERSRSRPAAGEPGARSAIWTACPIVLLSLCLSGCGQFALVRRDQPQPRPSVSTPLPASAAPLGTAMLQPAVADLSDRPVARPAAFKRYYVGPLHEASGNGRGQGSYYVREQPDYPTRNGVPISAPSGPTTMWTESAHAPEPLPAEIRDTLAEAQRTMSAMAAENARLAAQLSALERNAKAQAQQSAPADGAGSDNAKNLAPAGASTAAPAAAQAPTDQFLRPAAARDVPVLSFRPNSANLIEITPELAFRSPGTPRVPFDQVYFPKPVLRESVFALTLVSPGAQPSAVLNKRIIAPGDAVDGFILKSAADVDEEGVWLSREFFRVRIPFQETPVTVRYPQP